MLTRLGGMMCLSRFLLGLSALLGASAVNPCLDPTNADDRCELNGNGLLDLRSCGILDEDVDDIASCFDDFGRENIVQVDLGRNALTTLPEGIFGDLTALTYLYLYNTALTTLPEGIFGDLTALTYLSLGRNHLTTLPEGIFGGLTALENLYLDDNDLTTLPEGIFEDLTALTHLDLDNNALTALPEGIVGGLSTLKHLYLRFNDLTTLPEGILGDLTALTHLSMHNNTLATLPEGIFGNLTALTYLDLSINVLTTLPEGIFGDLTALTHLDLEYNALDCLPVIPTALVEDDSLIVDPYGNECACSAANVTNVCGQATCTPGEFGYTCDTSPVPTPVPFVGTSTTGPVASNPPEPKTPSDSTPIIVGVVSAVACATLTALGVLLKRRRVLKQKTVQPASISPGGDDDNIEQGSDQPQDDAPPPRSAVPAIGVEGGKSPSYWRHASPSSDIAEYDWNNSGDINPKSAPAFLAGPVQPSTEHAKHAAAADYGNAEVLAVGGRDDKITAYQDAVSPHWCMPVEKPPPYSYIESMHRLSPVLEDAVSGRDTVSPSTTAPPDGAAATEDAAAEDNGAGLAGEEDAAIGSADRSLTAVASTTTSSTPNVSTVEQEEVFRFRRRQLDTDGAPVAGGPPPEGGSSGGGGTGASPVASRQNSAGDIVLHQAVLAAAQELAQSCHIPGVGEAARAVCIMAHLLSDNRESDKGISSRLQRCHSMVLALERADEIIDKGGDAVGKAARIFIEDVRDAIFDLVELIKTFKNKNKLSQLLLSPLFKRRQEELDAVVDRAIKRLQWSLSESVSESAAEARRIRRQRKLDQVEIPEEQ